MKGSITAFTCSSLEKVFLAREAPEVDTFTYASCLKNEVFSFQVAYRLTTGGPSKLSVKIEVESNIGDHIRVRSVGHVPSELPAYSEADGNYITTSPGLFPDPLYTLDDSTLFLQANYYRSLWITVAPGTSDIPAGTHPIRILFKAAADGTLLGGCDFELKVIDKRLPDQKLLYTQWLHCDCISNYYDVEVFSENFWEYVRNFIRTAVKNGVNMLLTPVFTPPLDTGIGGERKTVQLVEVYAESGGYRFRFDRLQRWFDMCREEGVQYFEMSHLFTQWGAKCAPKVMGYKDGKYQRLFGWETHSSGEAYSGFLHAFLPQLTDVIRKNGLEKHVYFHISDEPVLEHLEQYKAAKAVVSDLLKDFKIIDALSNYEFYAQGVVTRPIPSSNHIEPFIENHVPDLWTYYCCSQKVDVSNRFFAMPSARNRIIGIQLYKFDIAGFLHWGYNFYNTQYSMKQINPYLVTDAEWAFPSGDAFSVYPGADGEAVESLRLVVFHEALQDLRAFELLARYRGKAYVMELIEGSLDYPVTFKKYPKSSRYILELREQVNRTLEVL